jgi:hypothetical protein
MKKLCAILIILVAVFSFAFVPSNASAAIAPGWHTVTIGYAGPLFGVMIIRVDAADGSFTNQWLELNPAMANELLATALTAMSMGAEARVWVANDAHDLVGIELQTAFSLLFTQ